jgi:hypothetical protein
MEDMRILFTLILIFLSNFTFAQKLRTNPRIIKYTSITYEKNTIPLDSLMGFYKDSQKVGVLMTRYSIGSDSLQSTFQCLDSYDFDLIDLYVFEHVGSNQVACKIKKNREVVNYDNKRGGFFIYTSNEIVKEYLELHGEVFSLKRIFEFNSINCFEAQNISNDEQVCWELNRVLNGIEEEIREQEENALAVSDKKKIQLTFSGGIESHSSMRTNAVIEERQNTSIQSADDFGFRIGTMVDLYNDKYFDSYDGESYAKISLGLNCAVSRASVVSRSQNSREASSFYSGMGVDSLIVYSKDITDFSRYSNVRIGPCIEYLKAFKLESNRRSSWLTLGLTLGGFISPFFEVKSDLTSGGYSYFGKSNLNGEEIALNYPEFGLSDFVSYDKYESGLLKFKGTGVYAKLQVAYGSDSMRFFCESTLMNERYINLTDNSISFISSPGPSYYNGILGAADEIGFLKIGVGFGVNISLK